MVFSEVKCSFSIFGPHLNDHCMDKVYKRKVLLFLVSLVTVSLISQAQIGIGTTSPNASAQLDVTSSTKGFLPPRVSLTATNAASPITSPANGLLVYNTATAGSSPNNVTPGYYYWDGSSWQRVNNGGTAQVPAWTSAGAIVFGATTTCSHAGYHGEKQHELPATGS